MKRKIVFILLAIIALIWVRDVSAQTFGTGVPVFGTTNAPLNVSGVFITNFLPVYVPQKTVTLTGISITNENASLSYGVVNVGGSNYVVGGTLNTNFLNGTNGGTCTITIPAATYNIQFVTYAQATITNLATGANITNNLFFP